jgi:hypothetical protein
MAHRKEDRLHLVSNQGITRHHKVGIRQVVGTSSLGHRQAKGTQVDTTLAMDRTHPGVMDSLQDLAGPRKRDMAPLQLAGLVVRLKAPANLEQSGYEFSHSLVK